MTENLIKRYLLEKAYEEGKEKEILRIGENKYQNVLFGQLKNGQIKLNELEFQLWLKELRARKTMFGTYLKQSGYLSNVDKIIEVTEDENFSCMRGMFFQGERERIIEPVGDNYCTRPNSNDLKGHLIINGMYANQLIYLARSYANGSFTIGYYGQEDSLYTKRVLEYYRNLRTVLKETTNDKCEVIEDNILNSDKVYLLTYNTQPIIKETTPVITRCSER